MMSHYLLVKSRLLFVTLLSFMLAVSCHRDILERLDSIQSQVDALKTAQAALEKRLYVASVITNEQGNVITFSDGTTATIRDGVNGADGNTIIASIVVKDTVVTFVLSNGETFDIPLYAAISLSFEPTSGIAVETGAIFDVVYHISSRLTPVKVEAISSSDLQVKVLEAENKLQIKVLKDVDEFSKVVVFATNGERMAMQTLSFEQATLQVNPSDILYFSNEGGTQDLSVITNLGFSVCIPENDMSWVSYTQTRAIEEHKGTILVSANETYDDRESILTVTGDGTSIVAQIRIVQSANRGFRLNSNKLTVMKDGGIFDVPLLANADVSVSIPLEYESWITQIQTRGLNETEITLSIAPNENTEPKKAELMVSAGGQTSPLFVRQFGVSRSIAIKHCNQTMLAPLFDDSQPSLPTLMVIDWGDNNADDYQPDIRHSYIGAEEHTMTIRCATDILPEFEIASLAGIKAIDLSDL